MRKKKKNKIKILIFALTGILILLIALLGIILSNKKEEKPEEETSKVVSLEDLQQEEINKVKNMNERARIQYYIGKYMKYLDNSYYSLAYSLLNEEFKENYFPTLESYYDYMVEYHVGKDYALEYTNFERLGEFYVVWVNVIDPINDDPMAEEKNEQTFVVKENNLAEFELSFSVKGVDEE